MKKIKILVITIAVLFAVVYTRPSFLYDDNGQLKIYGYNEENKTILPLPVLFVVAAIFIYLFVLVYK